MPEQKAKQRAGSKSTDLAEGELDTVEASLRIHEGKGETGPSKRAPDPGVRSMDLAEGERDTVEESLRIHEKKGDLQVRKPSKR